MEYIKDCLKEVWPMMLVVSVILVSLKLVNIIDKKDKIKLNDIVTLLFVNYIIALFYLISFQDVSWSTYNIEPFKEILRYEFGSKMFFKNIIGNVLLFVPYGFFTTYFLDLKKLHLSIILGFLASLVIEVTQLLIGRVFDIDDLLLNVIGNCLGFMLYRIIRSIRGKYEQNRNIQSNKQRNKRIRYN